MLSSGYNSNARENFLKMEEQTVPSAGFSPQPEYMTPDCGSNNYYGVVHQQHQSNGPQQQQQQPHHHNQHHHPQQQQQQHQPQQLHSTMSLDYSNLADSFDLSLLEDSYDKDMATVPSPSSWSPLGALESNAWQQVSFYAASPPEFRAFSPDCKPFRGEQQQQQQSNAKNNNNSNTNNNTVPLANNGTHTPPPPQQQQQPILDVLSYPSGGPGSAAAVAGAANVTALSSVDHDACNRNNALLRQCLEDNTFIEKYNFKPLDLPITSLPNEMEATMENNNAVPAGATNAAAVGSTTLELNQIEPVFNLAYEQIITDMQNTCRTLAISPDPMQWSVEDVQSWLCYSLTSFSHERGTNPASGNSAATNSAITSSIRALWNIDGQRLCSLNEEEFRRRDPLNGERIFANLELLKMWKCSADLQQSATQHQQSGVAPLQAESNCQAQQPFDLGQILLAAGAATSGGNGVYSCSGSPASAMEQSPAPPSNFVEDIKVELEDSPMQQASHQQTKFSNPASVDTASSSSSSMRHSDDDDEDDEEEDEKPAPSGVKTKACGTKNGAHIHLWQFLKELLASGQQHGSCIRWLDQSRGVFKIEDSVRVARLWGIRKNRPAMNYDKLSRSIRQYYRKGIMRKTERSQRLVYQFCHPYGL